MLLLVCLAGWAIIAVGCMALGSTGFGWPKTEMIWSLRREATLVASLIGASLALAGVTYQAVLRNPLAEPYLLGVSSGASLAVFAWSTISFATLYLASISQQAAAFLGGIGTLAIVFLLAQRRGRLEPLTLLLVGVIINAINGALFLLVFFLARSTDLQKAFRFLAGGLQPDLAQSQVLTVAILFAVSLAILLIISGQLNISMLSEAEAQSLGVRIHRLRWMAMVVASLATASAMAISGPIGFVGLVCPHLGRLLVGNDQRKLIPVATALGASLLAIADACSRTMGQLPVGVLTGFLGGPFFLFLLWQSRKQGDRT
ncbi:MAG TPA: iron ABC transporter permease [Chloroflexota bacterium]|nr:iron ABC transporter permease [Chloroflexota bacterium]